jgi:predicted dehydrogenase
MNRRIFLKRAVLTTAALSTVRIHSSLNLLAAPASGNKIRYAQIGCGGRAMTHLGAAIDEELVAIVDVAENRLAAVKKWLKEKNHDPEKVKTFIDYRKMFDSIGKQLDAVFIATPNHHHALPAMIAMQMGKAVYCEKPLCRDIAEARKLRQMAQHYKVPTQMGNQGHCEEGYRKLCEYIWSGVIGNVTETHSWTNRANGGVGPRPPSEPVPPGLHWDEWIGPAPYRDYHSDLHPHEWHGWYDFGNGSIGNMGCHVLDGVFWALKVEHPTSIEALDMRGGSNERYPTGSRICWTIPARGTMPPAKIYWYEGLNKTTKEEPKGNLRIAVGDARNLPPLLTDLRQRYTEEDFDSTDSGTFYVGDKGIIYTGTYGNDMHIVPWTKMKETPPPPQSLPRFKEGIFKNFIEACRSGKTDTAVNFDYGTKLTEFALLGNLAQHAGEGKKIEWDGPKMKVKNIKELNAWVKRKYRSGWRA